MSSIEQKKLAVIDSATEIFLRRGIAGLTMNEIADECTIGIATLYRYYPQKKYLVIACAAKMWRDRYEIIKHVYDQNTDKTGFEQFKILGNYFPWMVFNDKRFWIFLHQFDAFRTGEKMTKDELKEYDAALAQIFDLFDAMYHLGLKDGTIREVEDFRNFYHAFTLAVLALSRKMFSESDGTILDDKYSKKFNLMLDMMAMYVSADNHTLCN